MNSVTITLERLAKAPPAPTSHTFSLADDKAVAKAQSATNDTMLFLIYYFTSKSEIDWMPGRPKYESTILPFK